MGALQPAVDDCPAPMMGETLSLRAALAWGTNLLAASGSESPRLDAELLLGHALALSRTQLYVHGDALVPAQSLEYYATLVQRRVAHEPVAYLLHARAFYDVELYVDSRVLVPRPETEHLVEEALAWHNHEPGRARHVVDVGTGSGALAIVLARHLPEAEVWAVDISPDALAVASENIRRYTLERRIGLLQSDLLGALEGPFDLIVANLPYIPHAEMASLPADVRYEPTLALDGGEAGLALIRRLLDQAVRKLASPGLLLLEIGDGQGALALEAAHAAFPEADLTLRRDIAGLERVVRIERLAIIKEGIDA